MHNSDTVCLKIPDEQRAVIDMAASLCGKSIPDFILECAKESAQVLLSEKRLFVLSQDKWDEFVSALDTPISENQSFQKTLSTPLPWHANRD